MQSLEKRLTSLKPHADFRLFLSMESSPKIPAYLGLPPNAEKLLLVGQGQRMIADLEKISDLLDEEEQLAAGPA